VAPIWRKAKDKSGSWRIRAVIFLVLVCILFSFGMSYAIWDKFSGVYHLVKLFSFFTAVQLFYWTINLFVLKLLR